MKRFPLLLLAVTISIPSVIAENAAPVPSHAQARISVANPKTEPVQIQIAPERPDWTYLPGDPVKFLVSVHSAGQPLADTSSRYQVGSEMLPAAEQSAKLTDGKLTIDGGTLATPGFIRCVASVERDGKTPGVTMMKPARPPRFMRLTISLPRLNTSRSHSRPDILPSPGKPPPAMHGLPTKSG